MTEPLTIPADKDPDRLSGADAAAHMTFVSLETRLGKVASAVINESIVVTSADPSWPDRFTAEAARLGREISALLVPGIEHIGSTAVPGLDAKPIIDIMLGISQPDRLEGLLPVLESLGYESLAIAGVPGRWALRRRTCDRLQHFGYRIRRRSLARKHRDPDLFVQVDVGTKAIRERHIQRGLHSRTAVRLFGRQTVDPRSYRCRGQRSGGTAAGQTRSDNAAIHRTFSETGCLWRQGSAAISHRPATGPAGVTLPDAAAIDDQPDRE